MGRRRRWLLSVTGLCSCVAALPSRLAARCGCAVCRSIVSFAPPRGVVILCEIRLLVISLLYISQIASSGRRSTSRTGLLRGRHGSARRTGSRVGRAGGGALGAVEPLRVRRGRGVRRGRCWLALLRGRATRQCRRLCCCGHAERREVVWPLTDVGRCGPLRSAARYIWGSLASDEVVALVWRLARRGGGGVSVM